jgi:predicted ArsR family transcriptional regulator
VQEVLQCLKKYGQRLDVEIAEEIRLPIATVRSRIAELRASGAVVTCKLTRYDGDRTIEAWECRVSGYAPKPAAGRKAKGPA